jgi:hypothetical protein
MSRFSGALAASMLAACVVSTSVRAENPLGIYVGVGIGESTVRSDNNIGFGGSSGYGVVDARGRAR